MATLFRRELMIIGAAATVVAQPLSTFASPASAGCFFHDSEIDPLAVTAQAMARAGWSVMRVDRRIDAVFFRLDHEGGKYGVWAGLTRPATRFVVEQMARRRGLWPIATVPPLWAFGYAGIAEAIG